MPDLPDYYTAALLAFTEVKSIFSGDIADRPAPPAVGDCYVCLDEEILYICYTAGAWTAIATLAAFEDHSARHEDTGADEISIAGLAGESVNLAAHKLVKAANATLGHVIVENGSDIDVDALGKLTLGAHAASHETTGGDEIDVGGLLGLLNDDQHVLDAEVKLIQLDDFAAPDDTTDLDATGALHGLMPKLDKTKIDTVDTDADVTGDNAPKAHAASHETTGGDEISVAGLLGLLNDDQHVLDAEVKLIKLDDFAAPDDTTDLDATGALHGLMPKADKTKIDTVATNADVTSANAPKAHKVSHQNGGTDEISVAALSGQLADDQHIVDAEAVSAAEAAGLALASGKNIKVISALTSDHTSSGLTAVMTAGAALLRSQLCYINADGKLETADKDSTTTMPAIALLFISLSEDEDGEVLLQGFVREDVWDWTPGVLLYVGDGGALTDDISGYTTGDQVQVVGVAITADIIYFNPSLELVEVA